MLIISHRGARGQGLENTLESIQKVRNLKISYIEIDIQYTKNNVVVLAHNTTTPKGTRIKDITYRALQREMSYVPTLRDALRACGDIPAMIESKSAGSIAKSLEIIDNSPKAVITSFLSEEILSARINLPNHKTFLLQHYYPFGIISKAKSLDAHGIGINKIYLPFIPYYYWQATKNNMSIYTYTLNSKFLAKLLAKFLPKLYICTDYPDKLINN
jgi:glycerophosphoryl diester phosphodiesterase